MRPLGRFLQVCGLVMLPVGLLFGQEGGPHAMALEFGLLIGGAVVFWFGLQLQRRSEG